MKISIYAFVLYCILFSAVLLGQENGATANQETATIEEGVGPVKWGSNFETVKGAVKGTLQFYTENKVIVSKDGEITYNYGFFYMDPEMTGGEKEDEAAAEAPAAPAEGAAAEPNGEAATQAGESEAQFSYVVMRFPYLALDDIKKKYVDKYGEPSTENIKDNRGVIIWENDKTMIALWVEEYQGKPFCGKINYMSKEVASKLDNYYQLIFNRKEMETLEAIQP